MIAYPGMSMFSTEQRDIVIVGLSLDELKRTNMRVGKLGTQVIAKQIGTNLIQRFAKTLGVNFE